MSINTGGDVLFEYATEGIIISNSKGLIIKINPAAEKLFGYDKGELLNKPVEVLIPATVRSKHEQYRKGYNQSPHPRSMGKGYDLKGLRKNGVELPVEVSLSPFTADNEHFVIAFIIDISERKKAEEKIKNYSHELEQQVEKRTMILREAVQELEKTKEELKGALLQEKELNEMKSRFVSMASHEFRTPLATILSSLSLLTKYTEQEQRDKREKHINRIKSSINNMTDILNDFLSISKLEEGKVILSPESFNLKEFCEEVTQEIQTIAKPGQHILLLYKAKAGEVTLDPKFLRNIIFNLISNAIKFSPEGKQITFDVSNDTKQITIQISDQGIGISEEDQKNLFERFFRGENATNIQGTGLGLNIVSKYIELMNGKIGVQSKLNEGTIFTLQIPFNNS